MMRKKFIFLLICLLIMSNVSLLAQECSYKACLSNTFDSVHVNWWRMSTYVDKDQSDTFDLVEGRSGDSVFTNFNALVTVLNTGSKSIIIELDQMVVYVLENQVKGKSMKLKGDLPDSTLNLFQSEGWSYEIRVENGLLVSSYQGNLVRMKIDSISCRLQWIELETNEFEYDETEGIAAGKLVRRIFRYELVQRLSSEVKVREFIIYNTIVEKDRKGFRLKPGYENYELNVISDN